MSFGMSEIRWRINLVRGYLAAEACRLLLQAVARVSWLRWLPRVLLRPAEHCLITLRGQDIFDAAFYVEHHADVRSAGIDPLTHYLSHGWKEGRSVNRCFDDGHYRAESGMVRGARMSALGHYLAFGRRIGLCPVPGVDLATHQNDRPEIAVARMHPYQHLVGALDVGREDYPDLSETLRRVGRLRPPSGTPEVAIVMPVHLNRAVSLNAICHVVEAVCATPFVLVVVNDAVPDAALREDLRRLSRRSVIQLLEFEANRGFVAATNRGMAEHPNLDVIWLNSDTEVFDGWIDRLRATAYGRKNVATVTPLTNNGTICSYPKTNADNPGALELSWPELDLVAAEVNPGISVESPTAVGFACYVRRDALNIVGELDEATFGVGYGEENDFSQRALQAGWVNLLAADVFVRHFGATSFKGRRADRIEAALKVLDRRYPGYHASINRFLDTDPLAAARSRIDRARLLRMRGASNVLIITHSAGGGTQQHVNEEIERLTADGRSVFLLTGGVGGTRAANLRHVRSGILPSFQRLDIREAALREVLIELNLNEIHVHHLIDFGVEGPSVLRRLVSAVDVPYAVTVHDYLAVCPRVTLTDRQGKYCGAPGVADCARCIERRGSRVGRPNIAAWRALHGEMLRAAMAVRVPDRDVERRLKRYFPWLENVHVRPHEAAETLAPRRPKPRREGGLRIAVIGAIGATKGFDSLLRAASYARKQGMQVTFTVIGYTCNDAAAREAGVSVTGVYVNSEADSLVEKVDPDLIWIPSLWPETYSYTLSIALRSGRPVVAFDIGALATRLEGVARATLVPLEASGYPAELFDHFRQALGTVERVEGPFVS